MYAKNNLHILLVAFVLGISICLEVIADSDKKPADKSQTPVYKPPKRGAPSTRIGGGTRGGDSQLSLRVLAPEHTGWTSKAQPVLYWYLSSSTNIVREIILYDGIAVEPLLAMRSRGSIPAGVHALRLADHHIQLQPNIEYEWSITLINEPQQPSKNIVASGTVTYIKAPSDLLIQVTNTEPALAARLFASQGYWYDAMESLSEHLKQQPNDQQLKQYRSALLGQVGFSGVAAYE